MPAGDPMSFENPYRPGAGHPPPFLAGRESEQDAFRELVKQRTVLRNAILTGLRGVGKTVLLDRLKPIALEQGWLWVGTDLSESASIDEDSMALRLLTDLSVVTSTLVTGAEQQATIGFGAEAISTNRTLNHRALLKIYQETPGLVSDRLKEVLEVVWRYLGAMGKKGIMFSYDEAQNLSDHAADRQYPLSILLDVFQSIQKKGVPFMLVLTGLPTLFPKLVEARTYSERMFKTLFLDRLDAKDSRKAVKKPLDIEGCPIKLTDHAVDVICKQSSGYPYFIQFICREAYDSVIQKLGSKEKPVVPIDEIIQKLDQDFFFGRWQRATDRQRELLYAASFLALSDPEFTIQQLAAKTREVLKKPFSSSHINQMLTALAERSLVYKNRHGKYSFAVPLMEGFIQRQPPPEGVKDSTPLFEALRLPY